MNDDLSSPLAMIDAPSPLTTTPEEWRAFLAELTPEAVPNSVQRAAMRRSAIRWLNWRLFRDAEALAGPTPWGSPADRGLRPI